jgi:hypothetical protein
MRSRRPHSTPKKKFLVCADPKTDGARFFALHNRREPDLIDQNDPKFADHCQKLLLELKNKISNPPIAPTVESQSSDGDVPSPMATEPNWLAFDELPEIDESMYYDLE